MVIWHLFFVQQSGCRGSDYEGDRLRVGTKGRSSIPLSAVCERFSFEDYFYETQRPVAWTFFVTLCFSIALEK